SSDQPGYAAEYRIVRADGQTRIIKDVAEKTFSGDGGLARVMGSVQDITDLRLVEHALRDSEERFRTLLDAVPALLWMADATGAVTYVSKPWCDYTGLSESHALGFDWTKVVHPDDLGRIREIETAAFERREPFSMDYRLLGADGTYRWFVDMGAPRFAPRSEE